MIEKFKNSFFSKKLTLSWKSWSDFFAHGTRDEQKSRSYVVLQSRLKEVNKFIVYSPLLEDACLEIETERKKANGEL